MKNYLLNILTRCADTQFGQDAIEHGIRTGAVSLVYHLDSDCRVITQAYDVLCESYREYIHAASSAYTSAFGVPPSVLAA